jgi:hypothetical protein
VGLKRWKFSILKRCAKEDDLRHALNEPEHVHRNFSIHFSFIFPFLRLLIANSNSDR